MAGKGLTYGIGLVRQLSPLYIRHQYSPTKAYNAVRARYPLSVSRNLFLSEYREIKSRFDFAPILARVGLHQVPRASLVNPTHRVLGNRYEYRLKFTRFDSETGTERTRYTTLYFDKRVSLSSALVELGRLQERLKQTDPRYEQSLGEWGDADETEQASIHSIHTSAVRR